MGDVDMVKQVLSDRKGLFPKNPVNDHVTRLLGKGLVLIDGDEWKHHWKVVHPVFNVDKLKVRSNNNIYEPRSTLHFTTAATQHFS